MGGGGLGKLLLHTDTLHHVVLNPCVVLSFTDPKNKSRKCGVAVEKPGHQ